MQQVDLPGAVDEQQPTAEQLPSQLQASGTIVESGSRHAGSSEKAGSISRPAIVKISAYPGVPEKLLYVCIDAEGTRTVVKFTTDYCLELHRHLSAVDLAPQTAGVSSTPWRLGHGGDAVAGPKRVGTLSGRTG